jgi:hypothetical protein
MTITGEAFGLIVAAIIAGWVSFFSLIISKEQSVSESRQNWIDELRKDVAAVISMVTAIHGESIAASKEHYAELWAKAKADLTQFNELAARIRLRLNPHESRPSEGTATRAVLGILVSLENIFESREPQFHQLKPLLTNLVNETQIILKENWDRVRAGERVYRIARWFTMGLAIAAAIAGLIYWLK